MTVYVLSNKSHKYPIRSDVTQWMQVDLTIYHLQYCNSSEKMFSKHLSFYFFIFFGQTMPLSSTHTGILLIKNLKLAEIEIQIFKKYSYLIGWKNRSDSEYRNSLYLSKAVCTTMQEYHPHSYFLDDVNKTHNFLSF